MQLHILIPDSELPSALRRPLVFGDREQISALYDLGERIEEMESEHFDIVEGLLKYYDVEIEYTGLYTAKIQAQNEADAREKARNDASIINIDIKENFITVKQIK